LNKFTVTLPMQSRNIIISGLFFNGIVILNFIYMALHFFSLLLSILISVSGCKSFSDPESPDSIDFTGYEYALVLHGGVVCLDALGRPAMVTNTSGMFRAYANSAGERVVAIFY